MLISNCDIYKTVVLAIQIKASLKYRDNIVSYRVALGDSHP